MRQDDKHVNEFKIVSSIGRGAYSKVKKVIRQYKDENDDTVKEEAYAMKVIWLIMSKIFR